MAVAGYDAVVVGAGAGGGAAAWRMTQRGWRVLLLDAGPAFDPLVDYGLDRSDWEKEGFRHKPGSQGEVGFAPMQSLDPALGLHSWNLVQGRTNPTRTRAVSGPGYHHVRGIGGSTLHYVGEAHRLNPRSMRLQSGFGAGADWPLTYDELEPFYVEVERLIGVAGPAETGERWRSAPYPLPANPRSLASHRLGQGAAALGLRWSVNPRAALPVAYDGRPPCNYCGGCTLGCPRRDKGSADVTFIAKAVATGRCDVRASHTVLRLGLAGGPGPKRVTSLDVADAAGRMQRIPVQRLVLACGAVETPRLLLLNGGIGGAQVGRHFLESVAWTSVADAGAPLQSFGGLPADAISWDRNGPDAIPGVVGGYRLSAAIHEAMMTGPIAHAQRAVPGFGHAHKAAMRRSVGSLVAVGAVGESLPNERCRVDLDPKRRDAFGRPLARIHSHVDAMTVKRLQAMAAAARALLAASGATRLVEEYGTYDHFSAAHVFGGCRMGADPRSSVVDAVGRVHGAVDLHVCDASVFPSSGGGEAPSLTIQALALRAVDRMTG